jgi:hypothetical protein
MPFIPFRLELLSEITDLFAHSGGAQQAAKMRDTCRPPPLPLSAPH